MARSLAGKITEKIVDLVPRSFLQRATYHSILKDLEANQKFRDEVVEWKGLNGEYYLPTTQRSEQEIDGYLIDMAVLNSEPMLYGYNFPNPDRITLNAYLEKVKPIVSFLKIVEDECRADTQGQTLLQMMPRLYAYTKEIWSSSKELSRLRAKTSKKLVEITNQLVEPQ